MDNNTSTKLPATAYNLILKGREFVVTGPVAYNSFRAWTLTGPNGAVYSVIQHPGAYGRRSGHRPFAPFTGRDLRINGNAVLVAVQPDGTLEAA